MPKGHTGPKKLERQAKTGPLETESQQKRFERRNSMNIANKTILITGANRGIGRALVNEALRRGKRVYAGTRGALQNADKRVMPLMLDVTSVSQIQQAVDQVDTLNVLINNADLALYDDNPPAGAAAASQAAP
jgi:NAD(P)-dependent dehydrogenase (short-subunit alcohol dehydrogenase family)